jgi:hypothetical protein
MPADIVNIPVPTGPAVRFWTGLQNSTDQVLAWNPDILNTVYLGFNPQIQAGGLNTIPLQPNASFQLPASRGMWVIGKVQGITPLVVVPGSAGMFRGLTQGLGSLALSAIFSPNFIHGISGWTINQDGSAEFNNLTIRGTFLGFNFILNASGLFLYSGVPALGNLITSVTSVAGVDTFGNAYAAQLGTYNTANGSSIVVESGQIFIVDGSSLDTWTISPVTIGTSYLLVQGAVSNVFIRQDGTLVAQDPNGVGNVPETWHPMAAGLLNGWTVTAGQIAQYRLMPEGSVWVSADLTAGVIAGGTNVWTVTSGYAPAATKNIDLIVKATAAVAQPLSRYFTVGAHFQTQNFVAADTPGGRFLINDRYELV